MNPENTPTKPKREPREIFVSHCEPEAPEVPKSHEAEAAEQAAKPEKTKGQKAKAEEPPVAPGK
jgi:hypothetical protein